MATESFEFEAGTAAGRLDKFLAQQVPDLSRSAVQRLIEGGQVAVNGALVKASYQLRPGDRVAVHLAEDEVPEALPEALPLRIVYEDESLLAVDKPAGMVVHPAPGHRGGTLVNAVLAHCPDLAAAGGERPGIVHRLDRDTSGLILVAKNEEIRRALQHQFQERQVDKGYMALVEGRLQPAWGRIEAPIGRDPHHRQRMAVLPEGRDAVTEYRVLEYLRPAGADGELTLIEARPRTGRTHQIRVHLASIGHPVVGDRIYGRRRVRLAVPRQFLHASRLGFRHPRTGERVELEALLAEDLAAVLATLRGQT